MAVDLRWLEQKAREAESEFSDMHSTRRDYDDLIHRYVRPVTDPRLGNIATGADYRTPDLEEAEHDVCDVLGETPRFDAVPGREGPAAEADANNAALWAARLNNILDEGGWWGRRLSAGQFRHGYKITRLLYRELEEPEGDREEYLKHCPPRFYLEDVDNLGVSWLRHANEIEMIFWEYELPLIRANEQYEVDGWRLGKEPGKRYRPLADRLHQNKLTWVGDDRAENNESAQWTEKVKVTVVEWRDHNDHCPICADKHGLWHGAEIVRLSGAKLQDGDVVDEYVLPYKYEPTLRLTVGRESADREPHFRYRPYGYPLFVEAATINWANTVLFALANKDSSWENVYAILGNMPPEVANRIPNEVFEKMAVKVPDQRSQEIPVLPELAVWPTNNLESTFLEMKRDAETRFRDKKPNRFLLGTAFDEATQATGSAYISSVQQAALPFDHLLKQQDKTRRRIMEDIFHAIRYWDVSRGDLPEWKHYVTLMGSETLAKGEAKPGKQLYLSASKLETNPELVLVTASETLAEKAERQRQALERWQAGFADDEQTMEELGYYDTTGQKKRIIKQRIRREMAPFMEQVRASLIRVMAPVIFDMDPSLIPPDPNMLAQMAAGPAGGGQSAPVGSDMEITGQRQPTIQLPPGAGSVSSGGVGGP